MSAWDDPAADPVGELIDTIEHLREHPYPVRFEVSPATLAVLRACRSDAERLNVVGVPFPLFTVAVGVDTADDVPDGKVRVSLSDGTTELRP